MKFVATLVLVLSAFASGAFAEEFKGVIADSHCAKSQVSKTMSPDHASCAAACIKKGAQAVLVTQDGKVYNLDDQKKAVEHAGHNVTIEGQLAGDTIKVSSIKM